MKLLWSSRSPFVRKVMVVAHEKGLADRIDLDRVVVAAAKVNPAVMAFNPLGKIPSLVLDGGETLFDSRVICEYLDSIGHGGSLFPAGETRWAALRWQAFGDGLMEAGVARLGEGNRPDGSRSEPHAVAFRLKIMSGLDRLEQESAALAAMHVTIGAVAVACALSYLDFRFAADGWRTGRPALAAWYARFADRPSMAATAFQDAY